MKVLRALMTVMVVFAVTVTLGLGTDANAAAGRTYTPSSHSQT